MDASPTIQELVSRWREAYEDRKELEHLAEEIKKGPEAQAEAEILTYLKLHGQESVRLTEGGGTVSRKTNLSVWMGDAETAGRFMLDRLKLAEASGRPLVDELLFQQRPHKSLALKLAEEKLNAAGIPVDFNSLNQALAEMGFKAVQTESLSFTKSK